MPLAYPISLLNANYWRKKPKFLLQNERAAVWTMMAVEEGRFRYRIGDVPGEASAGDIVLCPPALDFRREMLTPLSFFYIKFVLSDCAADEEERIERLLRDWFGYKFTTPEQDRLFNNFRHLLGHFMIGDMHTNRGVVHYVNDVWMLFGAEVESLTRYDGASKDPLMREAKDWIDRHAFTDIQMRDVAKLFDMHPVQFTRRFQSIFGLLPSRYLFSIRMERAKWLLVQTDCTLDDIARQCGYDNGYYFSRMFTKYARMNPSKFRKLHAMPI
ncbi:helix-turn-helix transcriptional regulator [Paenibacillus sp. GYB003]|uniref:helix-turn-helix transcriptional regulator n=1 Tax=Paenibacillus sp. GYB003 TaxID=2994392 RepID=UPI002F966987